jgi:hypothetical protein
MHWRLSHARLLLAMLLHQQLKEAMCKALVLTTPEFTKTFIVECDALGNGIGIVLMQEGRPLSFESDPLKGKE